MIKPTNLIALLVLTTSASPALATETVTYSYDALGRLTTVAHSGSVNGSLQSSYSYDPADNRSNVTVTGAGSGSSQVIVVPLGGLMVMPISTSQ